MNLLPLYQSILLFAGVLNAHADSSIVSYQEIARRVNAMECQAIVLSGPPSIPQRPAGERPSLSWQVTARLRGLFDERAARARNASLQEQRRYDAALRTYENLMRELNEAKVRARKVLENLPQQNYLAEQPLDPSLRGLTEVLRRKAMQLLDEANSPELVTEIAGWILEQGQAIGQLSDHLHVVRRTAIENLDRLAAPAMRWTLENRLQELEAALAVARNRIAVASSEVEISEIFVETETAIRPILTEFSISESYRQEREMRYDPALAASAARIVTDLGAVAQLLRRVLQIYEPGTVARVQDPEQLLGLLNASEALRHFLYAELQLVRRLASLAAVRGEQPPPGPARHRRPMEHGSAVAARIAGGALMRLNNSILVAREARLPIAVIERLRLALRSLDHADSVEGILAPGALPLNLFQQEALFEAAVQSEPLRLAILGTSLELRSIEGPPQPPTPPALEPPPFIFAPLRVTQPDDALSIRQSIERRNQEAQAWIRSWHRFQEEEALFLQGPWAEYLRRFEQARQAYQRRKESRTAVFAYIAAVFPEFFRSPLELSTFVHQIRTVNTARLRNLPSGLSERLEEMATEHTAAVQAASRGNRTPNPDFGARLELREAFIFLYTVHPLWLIDRNHAYVPLLWDLYSNSVQTEPEPIFNFRRYFDLPQSTGGPVRPETIPSIQTMFSHFAGAWSVNFAVAPYAARTEPVEGVTAAAAEAGTIENLAQGTIVLPEVSNAGGALDREPVYRRVPIPTAPVAIQPLPSYARPPADGGTLTILPSPDQNPR